MKLGSMALALGLALGVTTVAEAKNKVVYPGVKVRKAKKTKDGKPIVPKGKRPVVKLSKAKPHKSK